MVSACLSEKTCVCASVRKPVGGGLFKFTNSTEISIISTEFTNTTHGNSHIRGKYSIQRICKAIELYFVLNTLACAISISSCPPPIFITLPMKWSLGHPSRYLLCCRRDTGASLLVANICLVASPEYVPTRTISSL